VTGPLRYDADGLHAFAAACEQHALDVCVHDQPALPATGYQSTVGADPFDCVGRCAHGEHGHRHVVMATSPPAPLPTLTLSQVHAWDTDHLETAATDWTATAARWRDAYRPRQRPHVANAIEFRSSDSRTDFPTHLRSHAREQLS
jgi:hypothetical protein